MPKLTNIHIFSLIHIFYLILSLLSSLCFCTTHPTPISLERLQLHNEWLKFIESSKCILMQYKDYILWKCNDIKTNSLEWQKDLYFNYLSVCFSFSQNVSLRAALDQVVSMLTKQWAAWKGVSSWVRNHLRIGELTVRPFKGLSCAKTIIQVPFTSKSLHPVKASFHYNLDKTGGYLTKIPPFHRYFIKRLR